MKKEYLKIKFNSGNLAILCSKCSRIIKVGKDFTKEELDFATGKSKKKLPAQYCLHCQLKDKVYSYPTKYPEGFIQSEIEELLKEFPTITLEDYNSKLGVHTAMLINYEIITYHSDVLLGITCCLENREINSLEWD